MGEKDERSGERDDELATTSEPRAPDHEAAGLRLSDLLTLPEPSRQLLSWMLREGDVKMTDAAAGLGWDEPTTLAVLDNLVAEGLVSEMGASGQVQYRVRLARHRTHGRGRDLWRRLGETSDD